METTHQQQQCKNRLVILTEFEMGMDSTLPLKGTAKVFRIDKAKAVDRLQKRTAYTG
jgi:hypothetical protein